MAEYNTVLELLDALDGAINNAMEDFAVVDYVKETLQNSMEKNVYKAYTPTMYERKRRGSSGGLADKDNMVITNCTGGVLEIEAQASGRTVQGYWGTVPADERIDDLIEAGGAGSYNVAFINQPPPGPRPFYKPAEEMLDKELLSELICTGIEAYI